MLIPVIFSSLAFFYAATLGAQELADQGPKPEISQEANQEADQAIKTGPEKNLKSVHLSPQIRSEKMPSNTMTIPLRVIGPFLTQTQVIEANALATQPEVAAMEEDKVMAGVGDKIFVKGINSFSNSPTSSKEALVLHYDVVRPGKAYRDPETQAVLGYEALHIGQADLTRPGQTSSQLSELLLTESQQEVLLHDKLVPQSRDAVQTQYEINYPKTDLQSAIISVLGGMDLVGQYNLVLIKGGKDKGLEPGDMLGIYQNPKAQRAMGASEGNLDLPSELVGQVMVVKTFDRLSFSLVTQAKKTIYVNDKIAKL